MSDELVVKGYRCWAMRSGLDGVGAGQRCKGVISNGGHPKLCAWHDREGAVIPDGWADESTPIFDPNAPLVLTP